MIKRLTINAEKPKGFWGSLMIHKMNRGHDAMTKWAFDRLHIKKNEVILDVGCGGGKAVARLHSIAENGKVFGVDYSSLSVQKALKKNRAAVCAGKVKIIQADVGHMPFENSMFDFVTAVETIYFWKDLPSCLKEIKRVLKSKGKLVIVCDMWQSEQGDAQKHEDVSDFLQMYLPKISELKELLEKTGFCNVRSKVHSQRQWLCIMADNA